MKKFVITFLSVFASCGFPVESFADVVDGPQTTYDTVDPRSVDAYVVGVKKNTITRLAVVGASGDIDCAVVSDDGSLLGEDTDDTSTCAISFFAVADMDVHVLVGNPGSQPVTYQLRIQ